MMMQKVYFNVRIVHADKPTVIQALKAVPGVVQVWVTFPPTPAIVTVRCEETTDKAILEQAVRNAGFETVA